MGLIGNLFMIFKFTFALRTKTTTQILGREF